MNPELVLLHAVERTLRPVVRQLLRHGTNIRVFADLAKRVYFQVARDEFTVPGRPQSDSRIALITGLTRREVAGLRKRSERQPVTSLDAHLATKLIDVWVHDARYCNAAGAPLYLPFESRKRDAPSFAELVRTVGGDIPPRALLDELVRVGCVELRATRTVHLLRRAYIPAADSPERLEMMGEDVAEFAAVVGHNLEVPAHDAFLQQKAVYDNIGSEGLEQLRAELRRLGETFLRRANKLIAGYDRDRNPQAPAGNPRRVAMGVYYSEAQVDEGK